MYTEPSGSPGNVGNCCTPPMRQMTGLNWNTLGGGQVGSGAPVSATPPTSPRLLTKFAEPLLPPSNSSWDITPLCHRKGTQLLPLVASPRALKPQKSSLCGSGLELSTTPATTPRLLILNAVPFELLRS